MLLVLETFLAALLVIFAYYKFSFQYWRKLKIPYVEPSIPFGNYPNPIKREKNWGDVVIDMYNSMKQKGHKYFGIYLFSQPCLVPIDPEYVKLFLVKEFQHFNYRNFYYNEKDDPVSAHLISLNGDKWRSLRTKMTPIFTTGKIKTIFQMFVECGQTLHETLEESFVKKTPFNAKEMFSSFASDVIVNCAFGLEVDKTRRSEFGVHSKEATNYNWLRCMVFYLGAAFPEVCRKLKFRQIAKSAGDFFIEVVGKTVDFRDKNNITRNDFLQLLINLRDQRKGEGEDFTVNEMAAQCFIFFLAGFETSATTMTFALFEIAKNPEIYGKIKKEVDEVLEKYGGEFSYDCVREMNYLEQVVKETLRLHSPAYYTSRICTKDYYFEDADINLKKGSSVLIPVRAIHLDPDLYPEPKKFDPDRFHPDNKNKIDQFSYLPFGEGPRICIGVRFALSEMKTALAMVVKNYTLSVNSRTIQPLRPDPKSFLYDAQGGIWLNCEKIAK